MFQTITKSIAHLLNSSDRFLFAIPRLVRFFLVYLLNNDVLDGKRNHLLKTIKRVDLAIDELMLTSRIPKVLPDNFNRALVNLFEVRPDVFYSAEPEEPVAEDTEMQTETTAMVEEVVEEEAATEPVADTPDEDSAPAESMDTESTNAWGSGTGWGGDDVDQTVVESMWGAPELGNWVIGEPEKISTFLGPTALPLTHTTGVIEQSTRRIRSVVPIPANPSAFAHSDKLSADAVEISLENKFCRVVLSPWSDPEVNFPVIHRLSKGPTLAQGEELPESVVGPKPHSPWKDDITILVEEETAEVLKKSIGMGMSGSFIQLARQSDFEPVGEGKSKKKNKRGDKRFWYVSGLSQTFTSFHVVKEKKPEATVGM